MIFNFNPCRQLLLTALWVLAVSTAAAQVSQGGQPIAWDDASFSSDYPVHTTAEVDLAELAAADAITDLVKTAAWRFGVEHSVTIAPETHGVWTEEAGVAVWRMGLHCPDALSVNANFSTFDLPEGAVVYLWNGQRSAFLGGFTAANNKEWNGLAVGLLEGETLVVELQMPAGLSASDALGMLAIDQVVHGYRSLLHHPESVAQQRSQGPFGNSGACNVNVNCPQGGDWQVTKRSVALITNGGFAVCTGALVNNTANDGTPYFLTANHCLGSPGSWVYYFNHESSDCGGSTGPTDQSVSGGTLLASSAGSDFGLIELSATPPASYNVEYAGWDNSGDIPNSATGIHHPSGDVKKICFENNSPYQSTSGSAAVWWIDQWEEGVTEPGSSGSPLFDHNQRIIGQLYGGAAACSGSTNNGQYDFYGRFDVSWTAGLSSYLDPLNTGAATLDGYPTGYNSDAGCMDVSACNYDATALEDDGSCAVDDACGICGGDGSSCSGCTDAAACNYDADAIADDGSCIMPDADGECGCFELTIVSDNYGAETTWEMTDADGNVMWSGGPYENNSTNVETNCFGSGCFTFTILDNFGDGICCEFGTGSYALVADGTTMASGGEFDDSESTSFCIGAGAGCTDSAACNYDADATINDGSCDYSCNGCTDAGACNYNPDATQDDGSCVMPDADGNCASCFDLTIITDEYGAETTWDLADAAGTVVWSGGPYTNTAVETLALSNCDLADGCYTFTIYDAFGDGICCAYGTGSYSLSAAGVVVAAGGEFGSSESTVFCSGGGVAGCADVAACNYNAEATIDDGSCNYDCTGCTDSTACNYDAAATIDDGSCAINDDCGVCDGDNSTCGGCTSAIACNYDPSAVADDGSCIFPDADGSCGCFELTLIADNYPGETTWELLNSAGDIVWAGGPYSAPGDTVIETGCFGGGCFTFTVYDSFSDGICCAYGNGSYALNFEGALMAAGGEFGAADTTEFCTDGEVSGCMDELACNYNPFATLDDGSCYYPDDLVYDCDGNCYNDEDGDGVCDEDEEVPGSFTELTYELVGYNTVGTMNTYRVYANFTDPTDELTAIFGFDDFPLGASSDMGFYQDPLGGPIPALVNPDLFSAFPDLEFDTWLTVGGADNTAAINQVGIDFTTFEAGGDLLVDDFTGGSVYVYPGMEPTALPDALGRVLIGQFTTDGEVTLLINLQYRMATGENPQVTGLELVFPDVAACPGDWNYDGLISVSDMLLCLSEFGCDTGCSYDMSGDGAVTTSDMLQMLALFGSSCPE
jgi:lysyl endopeptidase